VVLFKKDRRRRALIAVSCLLFAGSASAQSAGEKTGVNSALGTPTTADFVKGSRLPICSKSSPAGLRS
jgi:hypothetical protein